jgi:VanZ family protein
MYPALRTLFIVLAIGWALVIYALSSQTGLYVPPLLIGQDKLLHALVFAILGFLVAGALLPAAGHTRRHHILIAVGLVAAYGMLDEVHQHFVPGRMPEVLDVLADISGGILGVWLFTRSLHKGRLGRP